MKDNYLNRSTLGARGFFLARGNRIERRRRVKKRRDQHHSLLRSLPLANEKTSGIQGTIGQVFLLKKHHHCNPLVITKTLNLIGGRAIIYEIYKLCLSLFLPFLRFSCTKLSSNAIH